MFVIHAQSTKPTSVELQISHCFDRKICCRQEYKKENIDCSDTAAVITMDYAQNLTLPSVTSTGILCRSSEFMFLVPSDDPVRHDLRCVYDGAHVARDHAEKLLAIYLKALPQPKVNAEKATQLYKSIRQYVPAEFQSDSLYAAPSLEQEQYAKAIKKRRRERRKEDAKTNIEEETPSDQSDA
ncbi:unnamed protein product [Phytophthora fragariaefolia]|uniref:Unnamed protein product n=1 Tax=Phytophthora fragariaefolia TaxID=1490495 RepID=A0A9W6Y9X9_9STRA|nr:unnamed protein product [Phytophthora fragariaefolia]